MKIRIVTVAAGALAVAGAFALHETGKAAPVPVRGPAHIRLAALTDVGTSILPNGGFEEGDPQPSSWTGGSPDATHRLSVTTIEAHSGKRSATMTVDAGAPPSYLSYSQYIHVSPGKRYAFSGWIKENGVQGSAGWFVHVYKGSDMVVNNQINVNPGTQDWQQVSDTISVPDEADTIQIGTVLYGTGTAYFDDARLLPPAPPQVSSVPTPPYRLKLPVGPLTGKISSEIPLSYGVCTDIGTFPHGGEKRYRDVGFRLMRSDFAWQDIEQTPGVYDFSKYDTQMAALEPLGVRPLWILDYTNSNYDNNQPPHTKEGIQGFANFARAAAEHFRNCGVIWEIWNEPNEPNFWSTGPNADQYAALVKATVPAIRAADPNATILAGAISQFNLPYVTAFLKDDPLKGVTAFSIHPYREGQPETVISDYAKVRSLIAKYTPPGRPPVPIVCSEWGYTTAIGKTSEADQARYLPRIYLTNLLCGVNTTINYNWQNDGSDPASDENRYGILHEDLTPKPAYTALAALLNTLRGYQFRHRIRGKSSADYALLFQGPSGLATVSWTSDASASDDAQTPHVTLIGKSSPTYPKLLRLALAKISPDDRPYPDVLPAIHGVVTSLTAGGPPLAPAGATPPAAADQPVVNSGFESGTGGWVPSSLSAGQRLGITNGVAHTGTMSAFMSAAPTNGPDWFNWSQTVTSVTPGDKYAFTGWLKKEDVHGPAGWFIHVSDANGQTVLNNTLTSQAGYSLGWDKVTTDFTIPPGGVSITIGTSLYGTGVAYFDDATLVKAGHTFRPASAQTYVKTPPLYRPGTQLNPNLGIGIRDVSDASFSEVAADGFTWIRIGALWDKTETVRGQYDWTGFNKICALCLKHHLKPEWLLIYGNSLYGSACTPDGITAFANFAKACAAQCVAQGIKGARYEIWNEPENFGWLGTLYNQPNANILDATQVAQINNASVGLIHASDPTALVCTSTYGSLQTEIYWGQSAFQGVPSPGQTRTFSNVPGLDSNGAFDAVALHTYSIGTVYGSTEGANGNDNPECLLAYNPTPSNPPADIYQKVTQWMVPKYVPGTKTYWVTECGRRLDNDCANNQDTFAYQWVRTTLCQWLAGIQWQAHYCFDGDSTWNFQGTKAEPAMTFLTKTTKGRSIASTSYPSFSGKLPPTNAVWSVTLSGSPTVKIVWVPIGSAAVPVPHGWTATDTYGSNLPVTNGTLPMQESSGIYYLKKPRQRSH